MTQTIRIDPAAHACLVEIARTKRLSLTEALSRAVDAYRRELSVQRESASQTASRRDPETWTAEHGEPDSWDSTLPNGIRGD